MTIKVTRFRDEDEPELTLISRVSYSRELLIALLVAVWIHVLVFFVFVILLVFELIAGKVIDSAENQVEEDVTELNITFEEELMDFAPVAPMPEKSNEAVRPKEQPKFADTQATQEMEKPEDAEFIGEQDTTATSDASAEQGAKGEVSLSGDREMKEEITTANTDFSDGENRGVGSESLNQGQVGDGIDALDQKEIKPTPNVVMLEQKEEASEEGFIKDIEGVEEMIQDQKVTKLDSEKPLEKLLPKADSAQPLDQPVEKLQVAKKQGGSRGGFESKKTKTRIRGSLNAQGKGTLNVLNTALGRYEAVIFKQIEREWQARNFQFRSHLAPGFITLRFLLDEKGKVSGQRRMDMRGASDIQWGIILNAVTAAKIPAMPKDVKKELDGDALELTVTFNY